MNNINNKLNLFFLIIYNSKLIFGKSKMPKTLSDLIMQESMTPRGGKNIFTTIPRNTPPLKNKLKRKILYPR